MTDNIIIDVDADNQRIQVVRNEDNTYNVINNDVVRHPNCDAESAMRALGFYINGLGHKLQKLSAPHPDEF